MNKENNLQREQGIGPGALFAPGTKWGEVLSRIEPYLTKNNAMAFGEY
jgi:hypothetical protein